ncbi:M20/M25/M40 family metallo-hydrolase [Penaeicola halotolerans]|uniref:M20/M25/M40 family metallo-hydrolase n=1 Tax=Penaeicola halotolerans TaxID=2793196 RepID=UPI001CF853D4|nr:M20/M25/M40 family metallo-hydrolase [Penaeicola halotolerans]
MKISLGICLLAGALWGCEAPKEDLDTVLTKINKDVLANSKAYQTLEDATSTIGHRLTGTANGAAAEEYAYNLFASYGLDVKYQPFEVVSWTRGTIETQIGAEGKLEYLPSVSLAHSPVEADVTGEIVDMGNGIQADYEAKPGAVKDKIALVYIGILPDSPEGTSNLHRSEKAKLAIDNGAKAIIIYNQVKDKVLLTGTASVDGDLIPIPAVCIGYEDGIALREKMKAQKQFARVQMTNTSAPIKARNVIATIKGSELPEEKIIIGGHLDSWDLATGATDNGLGTFAIMDMARSFKQLGLKPKRTIEFIMFMGEEQGLLGSRAYVEEAKANGTLDQVKYMFNQDMSGNPIGMNLGGRTEAEAFFKEVGQKINGIDSLYSNLTRTGAGLHSDHQPFMLEGVPTMSPISNLNADIFLCYHADCDDFDLIVEEHILNNVRFSGMVLYALADADQLPAAKLSDEETKTFMQEKGLELKLRLGGDWRWGM